MIQKNPVFIHKTEKTYTKIKLYIPPLIGGDTRITPSPRTNNIGTVLLVGCKKKISHI